MKCKVCNPVFWYLLVISFLSLFFISCADDLSPSNEAEHEVATTYISGIDTRIEKLDVNGDGRREYETIEYFRGTNEVLTIIRDEKKSTHIIPIGEHVFLEHDSDGDGMFEQITIMKGRIPIESLRRNDDGHLTPMAKEELYNLKKSSQQAAKMAQEAVDAALKEDDK